LTRLPEKRANNKIFTTSSASHYFKKALKYPLAVIKGYNCCVFAYGQTGAGKTFSILGDANELAENSLAESRGVLPRFLEELFLELRKMRSKSSIKCSYLEIYN
jgi:hypothetical protein